MNSPELERFLATLYVDADARARFLEAPQEEARRAGLADEQCRALERIDRVGLEMAARSFERKRAVKERRRGVQGRSTPLWSRLLSALLKEPRL
jgi:hypothetical protein